MGSNCSGTHNDRAYVGWKRHDESAIAGAKTRRSDVALDEYITMIKDLAVACSDRRGRMRAARREEMYNIKCF